MNYVYIVECKDGTFYTGWTNDLENRISMHNSGKGAKYTSCRFPVELKYFEEHDTKQSAMKREFEIKRFSKKEKLSLIDVNKCVG